MTNPEPFGLIRLSAPQLQHPELLAGLEIWLQMGLISSAQVQQFCEQHLVCQLADQPVSHASNSLATHGSTDFAPGDFADAVSAPVAAVRIPGQIPVQIPVQILAEPTGWIARMLQAFMAEIGVIWLLCLGVFMVVVSSGVLAASQWQNFSPIGQYLILFTYTLAFWGAGLWADRRPALRLTARMLQIATLLILPVNFWMMDGLNLWRQGLGILVNLVAALVLSGITRSLLPRLTSRYQLPLINALGLNWLHWGWSIAGIPVLTTYLGTIGTAVLTYRQAEFLRPEDSENSEVAGQSSQLAVSMVIVGLATLLLIGRAILAAQVPVSQLGLAFGICGWLFCWLTRQSRFQLSRLWSNLGVGLLLLGWAVSIAANPPWQAVAVSGLGLWLLGDRLLRDRLENSPSEQPHQNPDALVIALLLLGLQTYLLLWRLIPEVFQQLLLDTAEQVFGAAGMPLVLLGLAGFPYLWLMLGWAHWQQQNLRLTRITKTMALGLGGLLILLGLSNPLVRSLVCSLAAGTLILSIRGRWRAAIWIYLCHLLILAAGFSAIEAVWPDLTTWAWAKILLICMGIEWMLNLGSSRWRQTCWPIGLGMAGLSYILLFSGIGNVSGVSGNHSALIWLITPTLLTVLSRLRHPHPRQAAWVSAVSLVAQLALLNSVSGWMIALGVALVLMLVNMLTLRTRAAALLTVGFGLGFTGTALDYFTDQLGFGWVMVLLAATLWLLWLLQDGLLQLGRGELPPLYAEAANLWAVGLGTVSLLSLSFYSLTHALGLITADQLEPGTPLRLVISGLLLVSAIAYRIWRQGSSELAFVGLGWAAELLLILGVSWQNGSTETLALLTLGLGLVTQLAGDLWVRQTGQPYRVAWHWMPLIYAGFGLCLGHVPLLADSRLMATTGFYTLAAALIGLAVGRRTRKILTILALLFVSVAAYELLIYQLMQASGGKAGDGITLLAGLAALIAVAEWLCQRWLCAYTRLSQSELAPVRDLHWGLGSALMPLALAAGLSAGGFWLWLLVGAVLSTYALIRGRQPDSSSANLWIYLGILQAVGLVSTALYRWIPDAAGLTAWAASLMAVTALLLYFPPWRNWGWNPNPWRNMALLLPAVVVMLTSSQITLQSLLIVAAFYGWMAKAERQPRLSYLGLLLLDWALLRYLNQQGWLHLTWISAVLAGSLLYVAQVDPTLQGARQQRHWLRSFAVGMLSLTLLYQAELETGATAVWISLLTLLGSMGLIGLGLALRTRAFLYVGTATFIIRILRLLWLFVDSYSLLLWAIGIVIGLMFIWIAATFEARRSQVSALVNYWLSEFERWE